MSNERELFDVWHYNRFLFENPEIDISNAKYIYDYSHKNALVAQLKESHFVVWQASAQREGFVLVNKDMTDEMAEVVAVQAKVCGGGALDIYDSIVKQAMIEAGAVK